MRGAKLYLILLLLVSLLAFTGCWGIRETDEIAYVLMIGFDKGEKDNTILTLSIANPKTATGNTQGGSGGEKTREIVSVEAFGPVAMLDLLNTAIDRHINLQHTKAFIFSEELAREGLGCWLSPLMRFRETRGTAEVFICRGKARDVIEKSNPFLELSPVKQIELVRKLSEAHGFFPVTQLIDLYLDTKSFSKEPAVPLTGVHEGEFESTRPGILKGGAGQYLAGEVPLSGKNKVQFIGTAAFRGDKLVGLLDGQETRYYLMLTGDFGFGLIGVKDPLNQSGAIGLRVQQGRKPKYKTRVDEEGNVTIDVELFLEPEIIASASANDFERSDLKPLLEEAFSRQTERHCQNLIKRTQNELRADIFGFGGKVKRKFLTEQPWEEYEWLEVYPEIQINVVAHTQIRRTGLLLKRIPTTKG